MGELAVKEPHGWPLLQLVRHHSNRAPGKVVGDGSELGSEYRLQLLALLVSVPNDRDPESESYIDGRHALPVSDF